jgi:hypothetical protein
LSIAYNSSIVTSGLVLCLDAGNPRSYPGSGTTVYDTTTTQPTTSMINGVTYTSGTSGYWTMDGVDDYIGGSNLTTTLAGGTMEIWTYITAINRNQGFYALNSASGSYINFWMPSSNAMRWEVIGNPASSYATIYATTTSVVNTWYHFLGTFNGTTTTIYVNGVAETSQTMANQPTGSYTAPVQVGRYDPSYPSASRISIARFYNRALSATEVSQNFNAQRGRYGI